MLENGCINAFVPSKTRILVRTTLLGGFLKLSSETKMNKMALKIVGLKIIRTLKASSNNCFNKKYVDELRILREFSHKYYCSPPC